LNFALYSGHLYTASSGSNLVFSGVCSANLSSVSPHPSRLDQGSITRSWKLQEISGHKKERNNKRDKKKHPYKYRETVRLSPPRKRA
jgi:hypothetical protein